MSTRASKPTASAEAPRICIPRDPVPRPLPAGLALGRVSAIRLIANKWVNGTVLHYCFVSAPGAAWPNGQKDVVRWAFGEWKAVGIGLEFVETADPGEAELKIGFDQADGSWSYVGTDVLRNSDRGRNMNFGWDLRTEWGNATALHEIGHAIGLPHGHQSPFAGITWNEDRVYEVFTGSPNFWDRQQILQNIIKKLDRSEVEGGAWDPESIMQYPFEAGLIAAPPPYDQMGIGQNIRLSDEDKTWVRRFYPPPPPSQSIGVMDLHPLDPTTGAQSDFVFEPEATRDYIIRTMGRSDAKIVVFVERDGEARHQAAEDDSGLSTNAEIKTKMIKGQRYVIRARTHYADAPEGLAMVVQ